MARRQSNEEFSVSDVGGWGESNNNKFNPLVVDFRRPIEAAWKIAGWFAVGIPFVTAIVWGVYDNSNLAGVIGITGRRAAGSAINETRPIGESLLNGTSGGRFSPGEGNRAQKNVDSLRPGSQPETSAVPADSGTVTNGVSQ